VFCAASVVNKEGGFSDYRAHRGIRRKTLLSNAVAPQSPIGLRLCRAVFSVEDGWPDLENLWQAAVRISGDLSGASERGGGKEWRCKI
jgi:hypothetical protein